MSPHASHRSLWLHLASCTHCCITHCRLWLAPQLTGQAFACRLLGDDQTQSQTLDLTFPEPEVARHTPTPRHGGMLPQMGQFQVVPGVYGSYEAAAARAQVSDDVFQSALQHTLQQPPHLQRQSLPAQVCPHCVLESRSVGLVVEGAQLARDKCRMSRAHLHCSWETGDGPWLGGDRTPLTWLEAWSLSFGKVLHEWGCGGLPWMTSTPAASTCLTSVQMQTRITAMCTSLAHPASMPPESLQAMQAPP